MRLSRQSCRHVVLPCSLDLKPCAIKYAQVITEKVAVFVKELRAGGPHADGAMKGSAAASDSAAAAKLSSPPQPTVESKSTSAAPVASKPPAKVPLVLHELICFLNFALFASRLKVRRCRMAYIISCTCRLVYWPYLGWTANPSGSIAVFHELSPHRRNS